MTFHIYFDDGTFTVTNGDTTITGLQTEAAAIHLAVSVAQDRGSHYALHYWRPDAA